MLQYKVFNMEFRECLHAAEKHLGLGGDFAWKDRQLECLEAVFAGKDLLAILPTGYGKSAIFQCVPFMLAQKFDCDQSIIVITPLNSIMMDQVKSLCNRGVKACYVDFEGCYYEADEEQETGFVKASTHMNDIKDHNIIYAHPESLLCSEGMKLCRSLRDKVCAVAVDEAHIVLEWYVPLILIVFCMEKALVLRILHHQGQIHCTRSHFEQLQSSANNHPCYEGLETCHSLVM